MPTTFIYRQVNGRIIAEKWNHDQINSATSKPHELGVVFKKALTDKEKGMSLDELKVTYPYQRKE